LKSISGVSYLSDMPDVNLNYAYFPIRIDSEIFGKSRDDVYEELKKHNIYVRRYFYRLISQFPTYRGLASEQPGKMVVAEKITKEIIYLPIYPDLSIDDVSRGVKVIRLVSER
jgi:dTDP-4-amino-4,6-dideoxygalactose transaminase